MFDNRSMNRRADNAGIAQAHYLEMEAKYKAQTNASVMSTKWLRADNLMVVDMPFNLEMSTLSDMQLDTAIIGEKRGSYNTRVIVTRETTTQAIMKAKGVATVLNFASYRHPGGGYINGARAQEECLCFDSNLYNILKEFQPIYTMQGTSVQGGVYYTSVFYTPDVIFNSAKKANVITCAAPNRGVARTNGYSDEYIEKVLIERAYSILYMAAKYSDCKTLILGAFGCGVFANEPDVVARVFRTVIDTYFSGVFETIVFAIVERQGDNKVSAFERAFGLV